MFRDILFNLTYPRQVYLKLKTKYWSLISDETDPNYSNQPNHPNPFIHNVSYSSLTKYK